LAQLALVAEVSQTLYSSSIAKNKKVRTRPFSVVLSGMVSVGCLGIGATLLFYSLRLMSLVVNALSEVVVGGTLMV